MRRYPAYKDSGVGWIGQVPIDWKVVRMKTVCTFAYGDSLANEERREGRIPVYGSNGIVGYHDKAITHRPCIVIGRKGSFGKVNYSEIECFPIDTTYFVDERLAKCNLKWLHYVLPLLELDKFSNDTGVPGLNREEAHDKRVPIPDESLQQAIASFLDRKTAQIDRLIAKKERMIELLKEERVAIINQAVTRGLQPTFMVDTNIFDKILTNNNAVERIKDSQIYITHVQEDQIDAIPNKKIEKKKKLLEIFKTLDAKKIPTSTMVWDVSRWDECCWGNEEDNRLHEKILKSTDDKDALIAVTAIKHGHTLITEDKDLKKSVIANGGRAISYDDFINGGYGDLKDSGVEWLGKIPRHWTVRKISRSFEFIGSGTTPDSSKPEYYDGDIDWVVTGDLNDGILKSSSKKITSLALKVCSALKQFPRGSILIAMYGATIGKTAIADFNGYCNQACCVISKSKYFFGKYTYYWFIANKQNIISLASGGGQPNISQDVVRTLRLPCPTTDEQKQIVGFLDQKTALIDNHMSRAQKSIELLKEYRAALISEVITGKIDVRGENYGRG